MTAGISTLPQPGPRTGATAGSAFDDISTMVGRDYVRRALGVRLHHIFRMADGRRISCAGPGFCRECNREARA